jgi:hypothetical protein
MRQDDLRQRKGTGAGPVIAAEDAPLMSGS